MAANRLLNQPAKKVSASPPTGADTSRCSPAKLRILIVDDNADAANTLGRLLALMGNETCVVHDGPTALVQLEQFAPDAVLLDLGMPGMDGLETAERIRLAPQGQGVAIIAVTGWGQERDRQQTAAAGFAAHLTKPVNMDQLEAILRSIVPQQP